MLHALLLLAGACGAGAQPSSVISRYGLSVSVVCQRGPPLERCRVDGASPSASGSRRTWSLKEGVKPGAGDGDGWDQCGFSIQKKAANEARGFRCLLRLQQQQQNGSKMADVFKIIVQKSSNDSRVYVSSTGQLTTNGVNDRFPNDEEFVLHDNDTLTATCAVPEFPLPSDMSWNLVDQNLTHDLTNRQTKHLHRRDLSVNQMKSSFRVKCRRKSKMFSCDVIFQSEVSENMETTPSMQVECEYAEDMVLPRPAIVVSPPITVAREGDRVTVVCHAESALKFCRIEKLAPNMEQSRRRWYLNENIPPSEDGMEYAGSGLSKGDCGFTMERVTVAFNAQFRCVVGFSNRPDEGSVVFNISVAGDMAMIVTPAVTVAREGSRVTVLCRAEGALQYCRIEKLAPNMEHSQLWWYLNENMPTSRDGVAYAGSGLSEGYCGFTVHRVTQAFNGQFRCVAGFGNRSDEGVGTFNISVLDCGGGPDDIKNGCGSFTCPSNAFQCANGVCIDKNGLCNGIKQCADGSDETTERCGMNTTTPKPTTQPMPSASCKLPPQPENGQYKFRGCDPPCQHPGQIVNNAYLIYICNPGFVLSGSRAVYCDEGWSAAFPTCSRTCAPLQFPSRDIECKLNDDKVECNQPMASGTRVRVKCKEFFTNPKEFDDFVTTCESNGEWSRQVFSCTPKCGEPNPNGVPFVAGGPEAKNGEFPWHAGIYKKFEGRYQQVCGGNIITERTIVTVAHCFWDIPLQVQIGSQEYRVAVGKFYREWYHPNDTRFQSPEIDRVVLPDRFRGSLRYYADDIAVVRLKQMIVMSVGIAPICVDYAKKFENVFFSGTTGIVMGWGYTENQNPSDTLRKATLPYVAFQTCEKKVPLSFVPYLTYDKFCAGYDNGTSVCGGDSGGGYAVQFGDGKYYLMGLVSVGVPGTNMECNHFQYTTFTKVFEFYDFIQDNIL